MYLTIRRIFTFLVCLVLLLLFVLPPRYLTRAVEQMEYLASSASDALRDNDFAAAAEHTATLIATCDAAGARMKWFVNHAGVDAVSLCWDIAAQAIAAGDNESALYALTEGACALEYLLSIETFSWDSLL